MSMNKNGDGGPAFPLPDAAPNGNGDVLSHYIQPGMSLRDWFAGQAMAGICASPGSYTHTTVSRPKVQRGSLR